MRSEEIEEGKEKMLVDNHIVFYDAECPLCRSVKAVVQKLDWKRELAWYPVQEVDEATQAKANAHKDMYDEIYMLTKDEDVLTGYYTVRKILSLLPVTRPLTAVLYFPLISKIGDLAYRFISTRRYRWFGRVAYTRS